MSRSLQHLTELVSSKPLSFCCPAAFFAANKQVRTGLLTERLGVSPSTARWWRAQYRMHHLDCKHNGGCLVDGAPPFMQVRLLLNMRNK